MHEESMCRISKNQKKLSCTLAFPDYPTLEIVTSKYRLLQHAIEHNIPCPKTRFVAHPDDIEGSLSDLQFPSVLRPSMGSGGEGITFVHAPEDLQSAEKNFFKIYGPHMIQEKIPFRNKYTVGVLCNADAQIRRVCVIKEIRNYPVETGAACYVETVEYPELVDISIKLMKSLNYFGIADIDFLVDERTKEPKLMEINPRFWGSLPVAIAAGVDFPGLLYEMMCNGDVKKSFDYKTGVRSRHVIIDDLLRLFSIVRGDYTDSYKIAALTEFLRINPQDSYYIFSLDDFRPFWRHVLNKLNNNIDFLRKARG